MKTKIPKIERITSSSAANGCEKEVTQKSVNSNFNFNYELYRKMSKEDKRCIAYHEAGHFIVQKFTENFKNYRTTAITIVPTEHFLGLTLFNFEYEKQILMDLEYYIDLIAIYLAGIVAEKIYYVSDSKVSTVGSADFEYATGVARELITTFSMIKGCEQNISYFSEEIKNQIDVKTNELIQKAEERARKILFNNILLLDMIAVELVKNVILDEKDLDRICEEAEEEKIKGQKLYKELMEEPD